VEVGSGVRVTQSADASDGATILQAGRDTLAWWITADSTTALDTGLADLTTTLVPQTADLPLEQRTRPALRRLATHASGLVIHSGGYC
jgi:hypothetical protein